MSADWPSMVDSVMRDALAAHAARLNELIVNTPLCMDCHARPVEVIHRQSAPDFALTGEDGEHWLTSDGDMRLQLTEVVRLLCAECSNRRLAIEGSVAT